MLGETDVAFALGQLHKLDPTFDVEVFIKDMETYMIPRVIDAYLKPDVPLLRLVTEGNVRAPRRAAARPALLCAVRRAACCVCGCAQLNGCCAFVCGACLRLRVR